MRITLTLSQDSATSFFAIQSFTVTTAWKTFAPQIAVEKVLWPEKLDDFRVKGMNVD